MHKEALTSNAAKIFPLLRQFSGFYLAGGTALALQIGHRVSVDFDLFSDEAIPKSQLKKTEEVFSSQSVESLVNNADELTALVDGVKVTFLHYPFPPQLSIAEVEGMPMLSPAEIAVTKAYTIGRRGEYKDYVDLYFCIKDDHITLADIIRLARKKYAERFSSRLFLEQLTYWNDVEEAEVQFLRDKSSQEDIASFLEEQVRGVDF